MNGGGAFGKKLVPRLDAEAFDIEGRNRDVRPPERVDYDLTPHELRHLKLLVEGYNYTTAAQELNVSYNTIKFHMRHIYEKLQVHSKSEAVAKAMRERLLN